MIELSPTTAFMVYLGVTLAVLLGIWVTQHYRSKSKPTLPSEQKLQVCEYCHFAYLDDSNKGVSKCPQCQSYNKG
jgi:uncharacterized paraquat-inducible protein A